MEDTVMRKVIIIMFVLMAVLLSGFVIFAEEKRVYVVTTLTDLSAIAKEVGGEFVKVDALAKGNEDPHFVIPKPSLIAKANRADLFIQVGMELEVWAESVLDASANPKIRPGQPGHVYASEGVDVLDKPKVMSRAEGDVHPEGNPHIMLDPLNAIKVAENILKGLKRVAPKHSEGFEENFKAFKKRVCERLYGEQLVKMFGCDVLIKLDRGGRLMGFLKEKSYKGKRLIDYLGGWHKEMFPFRGRRLVTYHRLWTYFVNRFGLEVLCELEPKPGIPPGAAHLLKLVKLIKQTGVKLILVAPYYSRKSADFVAERTDCEVVVCATSVGGQKGVDDYFKLIDNIISKLRNAWKKGK